MKGTISVEAEKNGFVLIKFAAAQKETVDALTLDLIAKGFDVLYEPRNVDGRYESCILCGEKLKFQAFFYPCSEPS